jgi:Transglutaminase-like superfamily
MNLEELRNVATDHARSARWAELASLEPELRADTEHWIGLWGPLCAIAQWHEGRTDARDLLEECISAGFHDVEALRQELDESFGTAADWPELRARMEANIPPPPVELTRWPCARPILPLELMRLDQAGEERLRARLPEPSTSALITAEELLGWVAGRWRHSTTGHVGTSDANLVLDRVEAGDRFACVEYTILLTQALNAVQIPARALSLLRPGYHASLGTAHAVTEAWIDDLGAWVLLDGQNGATWRDSDDRPLSALELQRRYQAGDRPQSGQPQSGQLWYVGCGRNFNADDADAWFNYFDTVSVGRGHAWSARPYVPIVEINRILRSSRLTNTDSDVAPDLSAISTSVTDQGGPALVFHADHPYATWFMMTDTATTAATALELAQPFPLTGEPGDRRLTVAMTTRYGTLGPRHLDYVIR